MRCCAFAVAALGEVAGMVAYHTSIILGSRDSAPARAARRQCCVWTVQA